RPGSGYGSAAASRSPAHLRRARRGLGPLEPELALDAGAVSGREAAALDGPGERARRQDLDPRIRRQIAAHDTTDDDRARRDVGVHGALGPDVHRAVENDVALEVAEHREGSLAADLALHLHPHADRRRRILESSPSVATEEAEIKTEECEQASHRNRSPFRYCRPQRRQRFHPTYTRGVTR